MIIRNSNKEPRPRNLSECSEAEIAYAEVKEDFLHLVSDYLNRNEREFGRSKALDRFLRSFNGGKLGAEIRERIRKKKVSRTSYFRWLALYEGKADPEVKGLVALVERYGTAETQIPENIRRVVEQLLWENYLARYADIYSDLQVVVSKNCLPSYSTIRRYVQAYRKKHWTELVMKHEGSKGLRDRGLIPAIGRADADVTRPNQRWEIDTTIGDVFTSESGEPVEFISKDKKRTKLIGIIDVFSRCAAYFFVERETALAVGQVLRHMFMVWGIPETIVIDNGKPFKNHRILRFLRLLGTAIHICDPGSPTQKPHIERSFRTLSESIFRRICGYSGNSVKNKPKEIEVKYTLAEMQKIVDDSIANIYDERVHGSTGQRPRERMAQPGFVAKKADPRDLDILLMQEFERKVTQGTIKFEGGKYFHKDLPANQKVKFRASDFDAGEILVFHEGSFLCIAEDMLRKGRTPQQIKAATKEWRRSVRTKIKEHEASLDLGKHQSRDRGIHALIEQGKQDKPTELPRKADIISFPELSGIPYSSPADSTQEQFIAESIPKQEISSERSRVICTRQEYFLDIRRRELAGEPLDNRDKSWLAEFMESVEYMLAKQLLDEKLATGAVG